MGSKTSEEAHMSELDRILMAEIRRLRTERDMWKSAAFAWDETARYWFLKYFNEGRDD